MHALLRTTFLGSCPACARASVFRTLFEVRESCPSCATVLKPSPGSHYGGPIVIGYGSGMAAALAAGGLLYLRFGIFPYMEWLMAFSAIPAVFLGFRLGAGFWTWLLWRTGAGATTPL